MKTLHFETLKPICPVCRDGEKTGSPLRIAHVLRGEANDVIEGVLHCSNANCQREYPIIDGIPLIVADLRTYLADNLLQVHGRRDLSETLESIIGDCCGPGSPLDTNRQQISAYAWEHYADLDVDDPDRGQAGSVLQIQTRGLESVDEIPEGPLLDVGCSVGRTTFELARRYDKLALGIDLNYSMLQIASEALRLGKVRYPRRRVGLVYDRREFAVDLSGAERVDFWACDATALPFAGSSFALAVGLNVLDSAHSPLELLRSLARVLRAGGKAVIGCPYDWTTAATPLENWLGGHSQRGPDRGACEPVLRLLLSSGTHPSSVPGLKICKEFDRMVWRIRLHDRSTMEYQVHLVIAESVGAMIDGGGRC